LQTWSSADKGERLLSDSKGILELKLICQIKSVELVPHRKSFFTFVTHLRSKIYFHGGSADETEGPTKTTATVAVSISNAASGINLISQ